MGDFFEGLAICLSVGMVFTPLIGYVLFSRYLKRKEKAALKEFSK